MVSPKKKRNVKASCKTSNKNNKTKKMQRPIKFVARRQNNKNNKKMMTNTSTYTRQVDRLSFSPSPLLSFSPSLLLPSSVQSGTRYFCVSA